MREHLGHFRLDDLARQALGDGGLADAGVADQQRVVLLPAAQDLDRARHLGLAADQRIDAAVPRLLVEVDAVSLERTFLFLRFAALLGFLRLARLGLLVDAARTARLESDRPGPLGDAVADVIDGVVARHVLLLQEIGGVALALGEDGDQHIGAGHFLAAGRLHVNGGALDDALEAGGGLGLLAVLDDEALQIVVDVAHDVLAQQVEIDIAGAHHRGGVGIVDQREQQVFERREFMAMLVGYGEGATQRLFERPGEYRHHDLISFP